MARQYARNERKQSSRSRRSPKGAATWHGAAFLVEALILLLVLVLCIAILTMSFTTSYSQGKDSRSIIEATVLASNVAEEFAADPQVVPETFSQDGLVVSTTVTATDTPAGVLYRADITVSQEGKDIYQLSSERYLSSKGGVA